MSFHGFMSQEELAYAYQRRRRKGGRKKGERGENRDQQMTEIRYASSDVFVFPSETETLGLVAIEAMAGGLPVVGVAARGTTLFSFFPSPQSHFSLPPYPRSVTLYQF